MVGCVYHMMQHGSVYATSYMKQGTLIRSEKVTGSGYTTILTLARKYVTSDQVCKQIHNIIID